MNGRLKSLDFNPNLATAIAWGMVLVGIVVMAFVGYAFIVVLHHS